MLKGFAVAAMLAAATGPALAEDPGAIADYSGQVVKEYVDGCIAANGGDPQALPKCTCSIDVLTTLLPYARYEAAATFLSIGQVAGERGAMLRTSRQASEAIGDLRTAQIEAELRCFED